MIKPLFGGSGAGGQVFELTGSAREGKLAAIDAGELGATLVGDRNGTALAGR